MKFIGIGVSVVGTVCIAARYKIPVSLPFESADDSVLRAFEEGRCMPALNRSIMVDRKELVETLLPVLQPEVCRSYAMVMGEKGAGKTTAINQALAALKSPTGAVYFDCPVFTKLFSVSLAKDISYRPQIDLVEAVRRKLESITKEEKSPGIKDEPEATFAKLSQPLMNTAAKFKAKYGRPMVLVIDSADTLAKQCPEFLGTLQDFAKKCADGGNLRIVFISSDRSAYNLLIGRGSKSRLATPVEIGETSDELGVEYLQKNGIPDDVAKIAVTNLTGGLFASLFSFVEDFQGGKSYEEQLMRSDRALDNELRKLGVAIDHALFLELVKDGSIATNHPAVIKMKDENVDALLKKNILAAHTNETYTFHDRHTAGWFRRVLKTGKKGYLANVFS